MSSTIQAIREQISGKKTGMEKEAAKLLRTTPIATYSFHISEGKCWNAFASVRKDDSKGAPSSSYIVSVYYGPSDIIMHGDRDGAFHTDAFIYPLNTASFSVKKKATFRFVHDREKDMGEEVRKLLEGHRVGVLGLFLRREVSGNRSLDDSIKRLGRFPHKLLERPPEPA